MRGAWYAILGLLVGSSPLLGQCTAEVRGSVIDESGKPVSGVKVSFLSNAPSYGKVARHFFETDASGSFMASFELKHPGSYHVLATEENLGYPDTMFAFYNDQEPPRVSLRCGATVSGVVVKLGSKAAYISQIEVVDSITGKPIEGASIKFQRSKPTIHGLSPEAFATTISATLMPVGPYFQGYPIPSNADISYQVSAAGYETSKPQIIRLAPSESKKLSLELRRLPPDVSNHP